MLGAAPTSGALGGAGTSRRVARRSRPWSRGELGRRPRRGLGSPRFPRRNGAGWLSEDQRLAWYPRQRPHPARTQLQPGAARRARVVACGGATRTETRELQVVEGRTPWSVPRLQPERERPDDLLRLLRAT